MAVTKSEKRLMGKLEESKLPVMLHTLMKVMELTEDVEASTEKLSEVILKDQGLTAAILRRVNSAFYSFSQEITTVKHAVVLLGFRTVKSMALGISLHELFGTKGKDSEQVLAYWRHSLATAVAAEMLAEISDGSSQEEAFIGGLLHDIGKMVMNSFMDEKYSDVLDLMGERKNVLDAENEIFGTNHVRVGQLAAEYWGLPRIYRSVIETHHVDTLPEVDEDQVGLCNIVYVANKLSSIFDAPIAGMTIDIDKLAKAASIRLSMTAAQLDDVIDKLPGKITEVARVLDIKVAEPEEIISILSRANIEIGRLCRVNEIANADLRVRVHRLSVLHKMSQMFAAQHSPHKIFEVAVQIVGLTFAVEKVSILYRRPGSNDLTIEAGIGIPEGLIENHARTPGDSVSAWVAENASPLLIKDLNNDERFNLSQFAQNYYTNSLISVPVICDRKVVGVLNINNKKSRKPLDEHDLTFAETVANQVGVALHSSQLFEKLQEKYMMERMEAQLIQTEKMAAMGQLAAGVAHEINNSVNYVANGIEPLRRHVSALKDLIEKYEAMAPSDDIKEKMAEARKGLKIDRRLEGVDELLTAMSNGVGRTTRVVTDLRNFSHIGEAEIQEIDLHETMDRSLSLLKSALDTRVTVKREYGDIPKLTCQAFQISQVLHSFLDNAQQAIEGRGSIVIRTSNDGEKVSIKITDTGCGIKEDVLPRIFDPFFTTKPVGEGTGLGLAVGYSVVKQHGGEIRVKSKPGVGTSFELILPVRNKFSKVLEDGDS